MGVPSGTGTEVLKYVQQNGLSNTTTSMITVDADHIVTILTITICNQTAGAVTCGVSTAPSGSGAAIIFAAQTIPSEGTYIWDNKMVMTGADILKVTCTASDHDVYVSYVEQDWS